MYFEINRKRRKKGFILVQKCYLLRCINCRNRHLHCKSTCFLGEAATVEMRIQKASFPDGAQPHTSPNPSGWGSFPRTAPIRQSHFPHTHLFIFFLFFFFFHLHLFYGVRMPAVPWSSPQGWMQNGTRWMQAVGRCCYRQGMTFGCSLRKSPAVCTVPYSKQPTSHQLQETIWMSQEEKPFCFLCFKERDVPFVNTKEKYWKYIEKSNFKLFLAYVAIFIFLY